MVIRWLVYSSRYIHWQYLSIVFIDRLLIDRSITAIIIIDHADKHTYNQMETTIEDVLKANDKDGYLIAVSDGSVKHMHQMSFG